MPRSTYPAVRLKLLLLAFQILIHGYEGSQALENAEEERPRAGHYHLLLQTEDKATSRLQGAPS